MERKRALIYLRVSTREQVENGLSLDTQEERLLSGCEFFGYEVAGVLRESGVSAGKPLKNRPAGKRLLAALAAGKADVVMAVSLDRLFRSLIECGELVKDWDRRGVVLRTLREGVDTSSSMGRFLVHIAASVGQMEREQLGERVSEVLQHKKLRRRRYTKRVYGFRDEHGLMVEVPAEQAVIRRMIRRRSEGASLKAIGEELMAKGCKAPNGGKRWHPETVRRIVENEIHAGS